MNEDKFDESNNSEDSKLFYYGILGLMSIISTHF